MNLDEAIKHAEEVADFLEDNASRYDINDPFENHMACRDGECAEEHRQLAEWLKELKEYKEQSGDAISRQAVLDIITFEDKWLFDAYGHNANTRIAFSGLKSRVKALSSITPQQRTGRWIIIDDCEQFIAKCSECGRIEDSRMINKYPYCHCGAKMQEVKK